MKIEGWKKQIAEQGSSGLSVSRFCRERGISESSFGYWRKKISLTGTSEGFARVERGGLIAVELPGGKTVRVDRCDLAAVLEVLCGA